MIPSGSPSCGCDLLCPCSNIGAKCTRNIVGSTPCCFPDNDTCVQEPQKETLKCGVGEGGELIYVEKAQIGCGVAAPVVPNPCAQEICAN